MRRPLVLLLLAAGPSPAVAGPQIYLDLGSVYRSYQKEAHASGWGAAVEHPWREKLAWVVRGRYLSVAQDQWRDANLAEDFYAEGYPASYRMAGAQASLRIYPWEWMPGFFAEGLLGGKRITGTMPGPGAMSYEPVGGELRYGYVSFTNYAVETAVGVGYRWSWSRLRIAAGLAFGPEFVFRGEGGTDYTDLLRFNALEIGCAL